MFKVSALVAAGVLMAATPAFAQSRAPITRGVTSSEIAEDVSAAQRQAAELKVEVNGLLGDMMNLTGRVETLEYNLNRAQRANEQLSADNEALSDELTTLRRSLEAQAQMINQLQAALGVEPTGTSTSSTTTTTTRTVYPGATQPGAGTTASGNNSGLREIPTRSEPTRTVTSSTGPTRIIRSGETVTNTTDPATTSSTTRVETRPAQPDDGTGLKELPSGTLGTIPASALPGQAGALFAEAKSRYVRFDYAGAEDAFRKFIDVFGNDPQAGEAHYWLGEALYNQKAYAESGSAYTTMIRSYPDDPRAPDALVKLARTMRILGENERACLALDTLPKRYPNASSVAKDLAAVERTKAGCTE